MLARWDASVPHTLERLTSPTADQRVHDNPHIHEQKNKPTQKQVGIPGLNSPNQNPNKRPEERHMK
jgi:hypothetical protein